MKVAASLLVIASAFALPALAQDKAKQPNGAYTTPRGKPLVLRYRIYLHDGDARAAKVAEHFTAFAAPARTATNR